MAVPNELVDEISLCGPKDRLQMWQDSPITTLNIMAFDVDTVRMMAELMTH